jgi:protease I
MSDEAKPNRASFQEEPKLKKRAAILVTDNFHVHEAYYPHFRLTEAGTDVFFVGEQAGKTYCDYNGEPLIADMSVEDALSQSFDLVYCPGGFAPMQLRKNPTMLAFARRHFESGRLLGAICHAASFLVALGILEGRRATCYPTLKDDVVNAGAEFIDDAPVVDGNLITARNPQDLPEFMEAILHLLGGAQPAAGSPDLPLAGASVAILLDQRYHVHQVYYPYFRFKALGADVLLTGERAGEACLSRVSKLQSTCDLSFEDALRKNLYAVIVPGDWAADKMRINASAQELLRKQLQNSGLVVSIAEGHSVLISAEELAGRKVACTDDYRVDVEYAGATATGERIIIDGSLITCASTQDMPELMRTITKNSALWNEI